MTDISDLQASVTALQTQVSAAITEIQNLAGTISTANASNDTSAIEAAVSQLNTMASNLQSALASAPGHATLQAGTTSHAE